MSFLLAGQGKLVIRLQPVHLIADLADAIMALITVQKRGMRIGSFPALLHDMRRVDQLIMQHRSTSTLPSPRH
jgi:hypothetical protein